MFVYEEINHNCPYAMPDELAFVRQEALKLNSDQQIVMIGCGPAVFGVAMLEQHPSQPKLTVVDIGSSYYAEAHMKGAGINLAKVQFVQIDSSVLGTFWTQPIDLLVIDGDHTLAGVLKDIDGWWDKLRVGGIAIFHDYLYRDNGFNGSGEWYFQDVYQAINLRRDESWSLVQQVGISVAFRKL